jgi:predicted nucleic acid-binding protein
LTKLEELLALFSRAPGVLFAAKAPALKVVFLDPADNKLIECAAALKADYAIIGNRGFFAVKKYMNAKVAAPTNKKILRQ